MKKTHFILAFTVLLLCITSCTAKEPQAVNEFGANPSFPAPEHALIPTVNIAPARGWPDGGMPKAAPGFKVNAFAANLEHPRWLYTLPNGDVLVAETNAPPKPDDAKGIKGYFMKKTMKKAGAGTESPNRIILLRDTDGDGVADSKTVFAEGLNSPFGMALVGNDFYVADTDALLRFTYHDGDTSLTGKGVKVADLPAGTINHHWTKNIVASPDGKHLFVSIGSNSNVGENGIGVETNRAGVMEIDPQTGESHMYAQGLRNPVGMAFQPDSNMLWAAVNERDELGDHLVPDYMTSVKQGAFYGWPYSYYGQHLDERMKPQRPDLVAKAVAPDYALGNHTASLGLTFYTAGLFPEHYRKGAFIGQHGSWNRSDKSGYKVVFVPFANGKPAGMPEDILTGFLDKDDNALGRPVGVIVDKQGALLVADDVGNAVWRVTPAK